MTNGWDSLRYIALHGIASSAMYINYIFTGSVPCIILTQWHNLEWKKEILASFSLKNYYRGVGIAYNTVRL